MAAGCRRGFLSFAAAVRKGDGKRGGRLRYGYVLLEYWIDKQISMFRPHNLTPLIVHLHNERRSGIIAVILFFSGMPGKNERIFYGSHFF